MPTPRVRSTKRGRKLSGMTPRRWLTPHYREIFEITRLADFLAINPDEDSAVSGAGRSTP